MQNKIFGYTRISSKIQNIERQIRNIKKEYPEAIIIQETFTGTTNSRPEFQKLLKVIKSGDTIIFDSVSRMSRNAQEGFTLYKELFLKSVNLVFLKEKHINTATYQSELERQKINLSVSTGDNATDNLINTVINALNTYILALAEKQIELAFEQSEKEVKDLQQRTKEGIETARRNGKKIGGTKGAPRKIKNKNSIKEIIKKYSRAFDGNLKDNNVIAIINANYHVARNTYYKYKNELKTA